MGCAASLSQAGSTCAASTLMRVLPLTQSFPVAAGCDSTKAADLTSYGVVVNSFSELENEYVGFCGKALWNKKVWTIGPVSLCNKDMLVKAARGNRAAISQHECLIWLDLRKPKSVVYVSFGSLCRLGPSQLMQIGLALEASKKPFIWVIKGVVEPKEIEKWIATGFEDRTKETGLIFRGWAPQILILSHPAIGGFLTHCGWNSTMESICAGVPMITWPLFGEQVLNEKLVVNVLKIGVDLGILRHAMWWNPVEKFDVLVTMEEISKAVERAATLALACLRTDPQSRPTMWNVSHRLSVSRAPIQRASHSITFGHLLDVQAGSVITVSLYQK
ncbi:UDP-glycosyltransferase [Asimina triloba]